MNASPDVRTGCVLGHLLLVGLLAFAVFVMHTVGRFAVNPEDPSQVVATTAEGVARSTDGGATFGSGEGAGMEYLSWGSPGALFGVDFTGALSSSSDGGATWKKTATVPGGQPQALTAVDERHILAATQDGIYESQDAGKT
ncbi:hypothetical protein Q5762_17120 [Streptomyces sp. P9(2023)]|uniref:WD40/YVTN/BNR-like repeat-containing protein n=1 Tax=Streptomyces sp. P9(2023) TaxID=3064394 RepID=UPI0028F3E5FE|nr:hypothetical protein [Streptomyces sp. P9(2023)]MDT9690026.1 hypothetical protein [Streptomyces sp. P9(2023)]